MARTIESDHQQALVRWADMRPLGEGRVGDFLYAVPNGGKRNAVTAAILKAEGVRAGVPDLCLAFPCGDYHGLYIEMKAPKTGRTSEAQETWILRLRSVGYAVVVCAGWDAARAVILKYLAGERVE